MDYSSDGPSLSSHFGVRGRWCPLLASGYPLCAKFSSLFVVSRQVGEGLPPELPVHRQLADALPPPAGEDAFLLPAHGQGQRPGRLFHAALCLFVLPASSSSSSSSSPSLSPSSRLAITLFSRTLAPTALRTSPSSCRRRAQETACTTSSCLCGPTTGPGRSSTPSCCCWRPCEDPLPPSSSLRVAAALRNARPVAAAKSLDGETVNCKKKQKRTLSSTGGSTWFMKPASCFLSAGGEAREELSHSSVVRLFPSCCDLGSE